MEGPTYINIGDEIALFSIEQDEGYISSGGLSEDRCIVRNVKDKDSAFKIYPMITYTSTKGLKRRIKRLKQQQGEVDTTELNKQLEILQDAENSTNETFLSQLEGKPLVYGQTIQLLHIRTSKWVQGKHKEDSTYLRLEKSGSQKGWFKVGSPDKSVKEGTRVVVNDTIILVHLASGCFIHQGSWADESGSYPLETSTTETDWQIKHFEVGGGRLRGLKHGEAVRFFHQEAGYLCGNRSLEVKCKSKPGTAAPTSYNTIWSVEQIHPSNEEISWGQSVRFKLLTSGMYLKISDEVGEDESRGLTLSQEGDHPNCTFSMVPVKKDSERITASSNLFIQSQSKYWVHCADELFGIDRGVKTSSLTEVTCTKTFNYNDAFIIKPASQSQIEQFEFVVQKLPIISEHLSKLKHGKSFNENEDKIVETTISELILFCTNSDDENPLTREGQTIKTHQSLLNSISFLEELAELCEISCELNPKLSTLCFRLMKQIAKENVKNGTLLKRFTDRFLLSPQVLTFFSLGASGPFIEMYHNNKSLLESVSRSHIKIFMNILQQTHNPELLKFLSTLCLCEDEPLPTNQKLIALELFESNRPLDEMLIRTKFKSDTEVIVEYNGEQLAVDKFTLKETQSEVLYFEYQLILYYTLCKGRNYTGIHFISKQISFREAFSCLKNEFMLPKFRSCYSNILLNVFVDCYPYSRTYSEFHFIWPIEPRPLQLDPPSGNSNSPGPAVPSPSSSALNRDGISKDPNGMSGSTGIHQPILGPKQKKEIPELPQVKNPKNLQEFLISYITNVYSFRFDRRQQQIGQPTFFHDVFVLLRYSILFGFFKNKEMFLFPRFKELLEVHPDYTHQNEPRTLPEHYRNVLLGVKYHVCKILEAYMDIQLNQVFGEFVKKFPTEDLADFSEFSVKKAMLTNLQETLTTTEINDDDEFELCGSLLQLLKLENDQLSSAALNVLVRILRSQSREADLLLYVPSVQLLTNPQDRESYANYQEKYDKIKKISSEKMSSAQKTEINSLIQFFISECGSDQPNYHHDRGKRINSNNQRTFSNLGLYEGIFNILKLPMEVENENEQFSPDQQYVEEGAKSEGMSEIFFSCYKFLRMFCLSNRTNQKIIFMYVPFMIDQLMRYRNLSTVILDTIDEVFNNNAELCSEISGKMIEPFVKLISEKQRQIDYLTFFKIIVTPQNQLLKANQNLVLEMLMREKIDDIVISTPSLVQDLETTTPRGKLRDEITEVPSFDEQQQINLDHHLKFVSLLALCAEGKNYEAEITCQKLFSVEDCLSVLSVHNDFRIRSAYIHLLDEVYLNTETTMQIHPSVILLATSDKMWSLIEDLAREIREFTEYPDGKHPENLYNEYVMKNILSFLKSYYSKCFVLKKATTHQTGITSSILERLVNLHKSLDEAKSASSGGVRLYNLISCIKVLHDLGVVCSLSTEVTKILGDTEMILQGLKDSDEPSLPTLTVGKATSGELEEEIMERIYNSIVFLMKNEADRTQYLEIFINQIRNTESKDIPLKLHALRTLSAMVKVLTNRFNRKDFQKQIANMEAPLFILDLLDSKDPALIEESLATINILLDDGMNEITPEPNTFVTDTIMNSFTSRGDEHFFQDLYNIIQTAKAGMKERKAKLLAKKKSETIMKKRLGVDINNPLDRQTIVESKNAKSGVLLRMLNQGLNQDDEIYDDLDRNDKEGDKNRFHIEKHYPHMLKIFRLLQLMSKGSGTAFKEYCRIQEDNYQSFDLVRETVQYLKVLESLIGSEDNFELAIQCYVTLREFAHGSPTNCEAIINSQVLTPINRTLTNEFSDFKNPSRPIDLKTEAVELLITITTQTENFELVNKIIANLDFNGIEAGTKPVSKGNCTGNEITLASACYRFIKGLSEIQDASSEGSPKVYQCLTQCEEHCKSRIGRIEILIEKQLKRLYFPIPASFRKFASDRSRDEEERIQNEKLLMYELEDDLGYQNIDWKKASEKVKGFVDWCEIILITKEHESSLSASGVAKFIVSKDSVWRNLSFFLAFLINFLIVIFGNDDTLGLDSSNSWLMITLRVLGAVQTITSFFMIVSYYLLSGLITHFQGWKHVYDRHRCYMLHSIVDRTSYIKTRVRPWWRYYAHSAKSFLTDSNSLFYIFYLLLSILGNAISPLFFAYHLFQTIVRSKNLKIVFQALAITKTTLALLFVLILQVMYVFSIISFSFFQKQYTEGFGCSSVIQCLSSNLYWGFPSEGGIFEFLNPYIWGGTEPWTQTFFWILFTFVFFIVIGITLLNVVFALIVDTFGQLRDKRQRMKEELNRCCLVCSIDRDKFQRKGKDFQKHLEDDHNPCQYLYFFAFLKEKREKGEDHQLTVDEKYAESKIKENGFLDLFPIDRALVLEGDEEEEDISKIFKKLDEMESRTQHLSRNVRSNQQNVSQLSHQVLSASEEMKKFRGRMEKGKQNHKSRPSVS